MAEWKAENVDVQTVKVVQPLFEKRDGTRYGPETTFFLYPIVGEIVSPEGERFKFADANIGERSVEKVQRIIDQRIDYHKKHATIADIPVEFERSVKPEPAAPTELQQFFQKVAQAKSLEAGLAAAPKIGATDKDIEAAKVNLEAAKAEILTIVKEKSADPEFETYLKALGSLQ